jgi:replicative DNA helicase
MSEIAKPWKGQKDGFVQALHYMKGRKDGAIKSIKTPWAKFNDAGTDGIEWNTLTVIAGRSGAGKTLVKDNIINQAFVLNKGQSFRVLEFQFEMMARVTALREFSSVVGKSYKYLCSADAPIADTDLQACYDYAKERVRYPIDVVEKPRTVSEIKTIIEMYMEEHASVIDDVKTYTNTIVTLDHSYLVKQATYEKDKHEMLYNLSEMLTEVKRKYPISFIILSQLNRNIDTPERNEDGRAGNYILTSDLMGADALLQHADILVGINRPGYFKIRYYGPDRYIIDNENIMVMHFLKCRNGDTRMSFFKCEFEKMSLLEIPAPPRQEKRLNTR